MDTTLDAGKAFVPAHAGKEKAISALYVNLELLKKTEIN